MQKKIQAFLQKLLRRRNRGLDKSAAVKPRFVFDKIPKNRHYCPTMKKPELLAPIGSFEMLTAAINAGCDTVYFGVAGLNMRVNTTKQFDLNDLREIAETCHKAKIKCYLALNTLIYDNEVEEMKKTVDAAKEAGVDAIICFDPSAIEYIKSIGMEVHISTQHSISNIEAVKFFSQWADRVVLARELTLEQINYICQQIREHNICGPKGNLVEIEIFVHGAMCVSVSGRCGMSLYMADTSANRGACSQPCRRAYTVTDKASKKELEIDNCFVMSPEDLCTVGMLDEIIATGVACLKLEGRGRSPEYVDTVVRCYREAIDAIADKSFAKEKVEDWNERLGTVFNRGLSDGFYRGKAWQYWAGMGGNKSSQVKELVGTVIKYYPKIKVVEINVHASDVSEGDELLLIGRTSGVVKAKATDMLIDESPIKLANKGDVITFKLDEKVRPNDKMYKIVSKEN